MNNSNFHHHNNHNNLNNYNNLTNHNHLNKTAPFNSPKVNKVTFSKECNVNSGSSTPGGKSYLAYTMSYKSRMSSDNSALDYSN